MYPLDMRYVGRLGKSRRDLGVTKTKSSLVGFSIIKDPSYNTQGVAAHD